MSYRLRFGGTTVECDTATEAMDLLRATRESGTGIKAEYDIKAIPPPMSIHPMSAKRPQRERVSSRVRDFLAALKEAYPGPVTISRMSEMLDTTPKGLPAVLVGVRVLLRRWNVPFAEVIERRKRVEGETKISQYRLTLKGMKVLQDQSDEKSEQIPLVPIRSIAMEDFYNKSETA